MATKSPTTSVTLNYPFEHDGKTIGALTVRRATLGDILSVQGGGTTQSPAEVELRMIALLSGHSSEALNRLDMQDYLQVQAVLQVMMRPAAA